MQDAVLNIGLSERFQMHNESHQTPQNSAQWFRGRIVSIIRDKIHPALLGLVTGGVSVMILAQSGLINFTVNKMIVIPIMSAVSFSFFKEIRKVTAIFNCVHKYMINSYAKKTCQECEKMLEERKHKMRILARDSSSISLKQALNLLNERNGVNLQVLQKNILKHCSIEKNNGEVELVQQHDHASPSRNLFKSLINILKSYTKMTIGIGCLYITIQFLLTYFVNTNTSHTNTLYNLLFREVSTFNMYMAKCLLYITSIMTAFQKILGYNFSTLKHRILCLDHEYVELYQIEQGLKEYFKNVDRVYDEYEKSKKEIKNPPEHKAIQTTWENQNKKIVFTAAIEG